VIRAGVRGMAVSGLGFLVFSLTGGALGAGNAQLIARLEAVDRLSTSISNSMTHGLGLRVYIAGKACDVLLVDSPEVNLKGGMPEMIHRGGGAYADIWKNRGIEGFVSSELPGVTQVVYRNRHNGMAWIFGSGQLKQPDAKGLKPCSYPKK